MSSSLLDRIFSISISRLYLLLLFFLPLLFSMKSSEVFEFPKMLFVYVMTTLIVACWIARMIINRKIIYSRTPLDIPIYFFLLSQLFSTFFSIDVHTSIFGYYSRWNGGLLSTIAYTLLYAAYISNKLQVTSDKQGVARAGTPPSDWTEASREAVGRGAAKRQDPVTIAILASAAIVSIYALLQRLGVDKHLWIQDVVTRVFSTQGQPNWLAGYLVIVTPLLWTLLLVSPSRVNRLSCYLVTWLFSFAIAFTRSRSGLLGLVVADVVFWSLLFLKRSDLGVRQGQAFRDSRLRRPFLIVHCVLLIVFLLTNNPAREWIVQSVKSSTLKVSDPNGRQASGSSSLSAIRYPLSADSITPSSDIRRIVWTGALQLVKERPWFGWGPETFAYTYWRVRPVAHNMTSEWNFLYNKAHNEWLNLAANTGLVGLGTHLLLLGWFSVWSLRQVSRSSSSFSPWPSSFILATLAALLGAEATNLFGFSTVTTQTYSYIFMGIAVAEGIRAKGQRLREAKTDLRVEKNGLRIPFIVYCLLFIVFLISLYLLSQILFFFFADLSYNRGKQFANDGYVQDALADLESAVDLIPDEPVFRSELAETQGVLAVSLALQDEEYATVSSLKDSSLTNFRIVGKQNPVNVSFLRTRARVTYTLGSLDSSLYDQGIELMRRAMELAPTDPKIPHNLGVMLEDRGQMDGAQKMFGKALELKPGYDEAKKALSSMNLTNKSN